MNHSTTVIGHERIHLTTVDSTNDYTQEMLSKSSPLEGTVITADFQTKGKGQIGRYWHSEAGKNLLVSCILYPDFILPRNQYLLNMSMALGVKQFIDLHSNVSSEIKWPNDIYINHKKIAGILIQNTLMGKSISHSIVGIGININQTHFPNEIPNPTSLALQDGRSRSLKDLYFSLFECLNNSYNTLRKDGPLVYLKYHNALYLKDVESTFYQDGFEFKGKIRRVDHSGQISIELNSGELRKFAFREIQFKLTPS